MRHIAQSTIRPSVWMPLAVMVAMLSLLALLPTYLVAQGDETEEPPGAAPDGKYVPVVVKVEAIYDTANGAPGDPVKGLRIEISAIPQRSPSGVPYGALTCTVDIRHQGTGLCLNDRPIRVSLRAGSNGFVSDTATCKHTSRLPLNSGVWLVTATVKPSMGLPIAFGDNAFSVNTTLQASQEISHDRKPYEAFLDKVDEFRKEVDEVAELHRKQGLVGAKTERKKWLEGLDYRAGELRAMQAKLGKNKIRALNFCSGLRESFGSLIDAYLSYGSQKINELLGAEIIIKDIIAQYGRQAFEKRLKKEGFEYDPEGSPKAKQEIAFIDAWLKGQSVLRTEALVKTRLYIANKLDIAIATASHLCDDLNSIRLMLESLFNAYLAAEKAFPVKPTAGVIWEKQWLDDYKEIETSIPNRYKPDENKMPGIFVYYPDIDVKLQNAIKAIRALRDEMLLELYIRHEIPEADREVLETIDGPEEGSDDEPDTPFGGEGGGSGGSGETKIKQPLPELIKNYTELAAIVAKERTIYVDPLLEVYAEFAAVRATLSLQRKPAPTVVSDSSRAIEKAEKIFDLRMAEYTLPKGTRRAIYNQYRKLLLMVGISMAGERDPIAESGATPGGPEGEEGGEGGGETPGGDVEGEGEGEGGEDTEPEQPPTDLVGKAKMFFDALLGAYDHFVDTLEGSLKGALLTEPLPEKPILRTFEQIAEDERKAKEEAERNAREGGDSTPSDR